MTFAALMVSLALDQPNESRLDVAGELAERFGAEVIGVAAGQFSPPLYFTAGEQAQELIWQGEAAVRRRLAELEAEFRDAVKMRARSLSWRSALDFPARHALAQARAADLVICGGQTAALGDAFSAAGPSDLVMQAGRPLLVVPDGIRWLDQRNALVAWKDTPESRRAVVDALPLLRRAQDVLVAEILEDDDERDACAARLADVVGWLARHGVVASARVAGSGRSVNVVRELDVVADDIMAGLIVAGAYGHSRFRELVLGGVTEHLVTQARRCVFLSH